jgi:itaconyl-CoA hydratase
MAAVNHYEDFEEGRRFSHHWGRTVGADEAIEFATQHLLHEPVLFNRSYAHHLGYRDVLVSPLFVYAIVLGMSVEDLSESGGPFLGSDAVEFLRPVFPGDTLFASSLVLSRRPSRSRSGFGVVEWKTVGHNQQREPVLAFRRSNLVRYRNPEKVEKPT